MPTTHLFLDARKHTNLFATGFMRLKQAIAEGLRFARASSQTTI